MAIKPSLLLVSMAVALSTWSLSINAKPPKLCYGPCPTPKVINLQDPVLEPVSLLNWARDAAVLSFHYDYTNMNQWLTQYSTYFDVRGWFHYYQALKKSGNMEKVSHNKLTVSSTPLEPPKILWQGVDLGIYKWRVEMPLLVQYETPEGKKIQQKLKITMSLRRTDESTGKQGIAIQRFIAKPI